jgi:hypothetical protein
LPAAALDACAAGRYIGINLFRSLTHHLAGGKAALPIEGWLAQFSGATSWLNSDLLTPQSLKGHNVLVDCWTYTCVNLAAHPPLRSTLGWNFSSKRRNDSGQLEPISSNNR